MPKRVEKLRQFNSKWKNEPWARGWLTESTHENTLHTAFCKVCATGIRAHKADLLRHTQSSAHKENMKSLFPDTRQAKLTNKHITILSKKNKQIEILLAVHVAVHSSINSIDHLSEIYNRISKDNSVSLHRTKCSLLIKKVIAPILLNDLLDDLKDCSYSLIIDESTDIAMIKYLCICIRYFSKTAQKILVCFLGLIEIEEATAECLYLKLKEFLKKLNLNVLNLIGIGTDGANNLCGQHNSLYTRLKEDNPNIQLIRCICHSLNNASCKAAEMLPSNLDFLCREIYSWFSHSSLRRIEYKRLYDILNKDKKIFHKFVQLCSTRWLCRYNVINIILEHYDELKLHFRVVVNKEKCYTARVLNEMLNDETNYLYLIILKPILNAVNKVNCIFQSTYVEIGNAMEDIKGLIFLLSNKILKPAFSVTINDIINNINNDLAYKEPNNIDFGIEYYMYFHQKKTTLLSKDINTLEQRISDYLKQLLKELVQRLPLDVNLFKNMQSLSPKVCLANNTRSKFSDLPLINVFINEEDLATAETEYNLLIHVDWNVLYGNDILVDTYSFWPIVAQHKNAGGSLAFNTIARYALKFLSLPMSNAAVERIFSIMNATKSKVRNRMNTEMLNSLLIIKSHFYANNYCCKNFVCTQKMLEKFNYSIYSNEERNNEETKQIEEDLYILEAINDTNEIDCYNEKD